MPLTTESNTDWCDVRRNVTGDTEDCCSVEHQDRLNFQKNYKTIKFQQQFISHQSSRKYWDDNPQLLRTKSAQNQNRGLRLKSCPLCTKHGRGELELASVNVQLYSRDSLRAALPCPCHLACYLLLDGGDWEPDFRQQQQQQQHQQQQVTSLLICVRCCQDWTLYVE